MNSRTQTSRSPARLMLMAALLLPLLVAGCGNQSGGAPEAMSHITRAETYADQGQYRSAMVEVRNAIQAEPGNVDHIIRLAGILREIGAHEQATELLQPWLEEHEQEVAIPLARSYMDRGKRLSAIETLDSFNPDSPEEELAVSLLEAESLRLAGDSSKALERFRSLSSDNPSNLEAIAGLARSHLDLRQTDRAIAALTDWTDRNGQEPEVLYLTGLAEYRNNALESATDTLTEAVGLVPSSDIFLPERRNILTLLSRVLTEQGEITQAQVYNRILSENSNTEAQELIQSAIAEIREGNIDEARAILQDVFELNPDNERVGLMLGTLAVGSGELEEGTRLLTENLDPETTPTQFIRAATMAQVDSGEREEALKTLERAIEARPNDEDLLAMHGILALSLPDHEEAGLVSLNKAISQDPERVRLRLALAQYHVNNNKPEQALGQLRMAFTVAPTDWNTTAAYLDLLIQQDEITEAEEIRDSLLNGFADLPDAILLASITDARLGNRESAKTRLESLVETEPQLQAPKVALASLYERLGENSKAVANLVEAARVTPDVITPLQQAGQIYARTHSVDEVKKWLGAISAQYPELARNADTLAALVNIRQGELAAARKLLDPWQDEDFNTVDRATGELLRAEAQAAARSGDFSTARARAAEAIALAPDNLRYALLPVGFAQMEGKLDEALAGLDAVEETFGTRAPVAIARATLLRQTESAGSAYDYLLAEWQGSENPALMPLLISLARSEAPDTLDTLTGSWIDSAPNDVAAHTARAEWLMNAERETDAASHYEQVILRQPDNIAALNNLAWALRDTNTSRALELADRARQLAPQNAAVLDTYGWILHLSGRHSEAKDMVEQALELAPENKDIKAHLAAITESL